MSHVPPPPIEYRTPGGTGSREPPEPFARQFLIGIGVGSLASLIIWLLGWDALTSQRGLSIGCGLLGAVPLLKLFVGLGLLIGRTHKGAGAGLICSIGVGALILLGSCFAHM